MQAFIYLFFSPTLQTLPALNHRAFKQNTHLLLSFFAKKKNVYDETQFNQELYIHTAGPH